MNSIIPAPGNRTFLTMAKIANIFHLKMIVPPTIYVGPQKNFLVYTDPLTGYVKITEDPLTN